MFLSGWNMAFATDMNQSANCVAVPLAKFDGLGETTAVGLTSPVASGFIRWIFYDQDGLLLDNGAQEVTSSQFNAFVMSSEVAPELSVNFGFLLFCLDSDGDGNISAGDNAGMAANAFQVDLAAQDVAFVPTIPIFRNDIDAVLVEQSMTDWISSPLVSMSVGANVGDSIMLQYLIDGVVDTGDKTTFYIFSINQPADPTALTFIGPAGFTQTLPVTMSNTRLNLISLEGVGGIDNAGLIGGGLANWIIDNSASDTFVFSIVKSPVFGASQTVLGNIQ
jgi:hypothetical protein